MPSRRRSFPGLGVYFLGAVVMVLLLLFWNLNQSRVGKFGRFNFVISTPEVSLVSVDTSGKVATVIMFPDDLVVPSVAHGYGQYKISKVFAVGELDKRGGQVLKDTTEVFLGVPVDGYLLSSRKFSGDLKKYLWNKEFLSEGGSLSLADKINLLRIVSGLRFDKIDVVKLEHFVSDTELADGSKALTLDRSNLRAILGSSFEESGVAGENLRVVVANSTKVPGLGSEAANILTALGVDVVSVESSGNLTARCEMRTQEKFRASKTVARLAEIFNCHLGALSDSENRANVVLIVGSDFADMMTH